MSYATRASTIESLESRQLFCGTLSPVATPAIAKPLPLTAAEVEGTYVGSVTESNGTQVPATIAVSGNLATLTVQTETLSEKVTPARLKAFEKGTFNVTFALKKAHVTTKGKIATGGVSVAGSYLTSTHARGTFSLTKLSQSA